MRTVLATRLLGILSALAILAPAPAFAAGEAYRVSEVDRSEYPTTRMQLTASTNTTGKVPDVEVMENGKKVDNVNVYAGRINQFENDPKPVVMLAIDTSDSMTGKIDAALAAARQLVSQARPGDRIGVVTFDGDVRTVIAPTDDLAAVDAALASAKLAKGTRLFDGLTTAGKEFPDDATRRIVVVLTDGADTGSKSTLDKVVSSYNKDGIEAYTVGMSGGTFVPTPLQKLADQTDGDAFTVSDAKELAPLYKTLGADLLRSYWIQYRSSQPPATDVKVVLNVDEENVTSSYSTPKVNAGGSAIRFETPKPAPVDKPALKLPGGALGMLIAVLPFGLLLGFFAYAWISKRGRTTIDDRIAPYTREEQKRVASERIDAGNRGRLLMAPLFRVTDSFLGRTTLFNRFRFLLEQANLPLRAVELLYMMIGGLFVGLFLGKVFLGHLLFVFAAGVLGGALPYLWVKYKARKRKRMFENQLADVLSAVAASLKAGHSFNQSIAGIIKETPDPTAEEFNRALGEARLGMPLEQALEAMAQRMGSPDFDFAVTTVNIQRTVGGSLSEILDMVADTVRNRQQFRKKVKALTSMGTASAYVLLGMPVFMAGFLSLINRDYMAPLFSTPTGHKLLMAGAFFMFLGYLGCKKIVNIKT